ncbi:MAG: ATP-binding protein, partial [Pseudolabrys sp.]
PVDLTQLLEALVAAANEIHTDDVNVTLSFEDGKPEDFHVPGHDSRLGQVVSNLIGNARSFSPPGGSVRVTCRKLKGEVEITVDDNGPGIPPDAVQKIFERFYTDRPEQGFGQNSGLGLSISKQIVEAHGGRIWAETRTAPATPGREAKELGARFVVRLPAE